MKTKNLLVLITVALIFVALTILSTIFFQVFNPITGFVGFYKIAFTDTLYVEIQSNPRIVIAKPDDAKTLLSLYMRDRNYMAENIYSKDLVFKSYDGKKNLKVKMKTNDVYSLWIIK